MARDEAPPFARGETYYNGEAIDVNNLGGVNYEGKEYLFEVNAPDDPLKTDPSGRPVRVKVVRNRSGATLKGKRLAHFLVGTTYPLETAVDGYTFAITDDVAGVIDEFLPPGGVVDKDLFYLVTEGPSVVTTVDSGLTNIAAGDRVAPGVGTGLTNADSGKLNKLTASPTALQFASRAGRSAVAQTSVTADTAILVHLSR